MFLANKRAHLGVALARITELDAFGLLLHTVHEFLENVLLHEHARAGAADFALVDEHAEQRAISGGVEVGIGKENVG